MKKLKKLYYQDKKEIITMYDSFLVNNSYSINPISEFFLIDGEWFQEYNYILAREMSINDLNEYHSVKYFMKKLCSDCNRPKSNQSKFNIFSEVNEYQKYLIENSIKWHSEFEQIFCRLNDTFMVLYNEYLSLQETYYLSHGDLHSKNILIDHSNKVNIIDYDEVCYAPKNFDLLIFIFRFYKTHVKIFNSKTIKILLEELKKENISVKYLNLYIIKVILQKKFLEYSGRLSPEDVIKDNWKGWYEDFVILNLHIGKK